MTAEYWLAEAHQLQPGAKTSVLVGASLISVHRA
jgi:hypothetical protein